MPRLDRDAAATGPRIQGFAAGGFRVDGIVYPAVLLTVARALAWDPPELARIRPDMVADALDPAPEFLLLGTGAALCRPPAAFVAALEARGIGLEAMDSRAAARAWGILRNEGRPIAAALLPLA